jgi:SAM-dependent methyltransferase
MAKRTRLFRLQPALEELLPLIEDWYFSSAGQGLLEKEQLLIDQQLQDCFGYHLLQLSVSTQFKLFEHSTVQSKYRSHPMVADGMASHGFDLVSNYHELPFETDSLDVVILHHAHEFVANPHDVIRELQRVVRPHGRLIIAGFNPWSLFGLRNLLARLKADSPWHQHLISGRRLMDWLGLMGFNVQRIHYVFPKPWPSFNNTTLERCSSSLRRSLYRSSLGACYVVSAVKEVAGMTPEKPVWSPLRKPFAGLSPVNSASSKEVA